MEDSSLFLRYILERITRDKQELMFKILRHLIRFVPKLPQQAAFALYNYIIGYVMFYVRSPHENGQKMIGAALSILWMVSSEYTNYNTNVLIKTFMQIGNRYVPKLQ